MKRMASFVTTLLVLLGLAVAGQPLRADDDTIKIGFIDPFSGAFAAGGDANLKQTQFILDYVNAKGGALGKKFEVITLDDNNTRNPDNRVQFLNCGQLATELTNEQCSFWHFRFAGSVEMRAVAQTKSLPQSVKSVYMLNQDYLFGQSVEKDSLISHRRREINQIRLSA